MTVHAFCSFIMLCVLSSCWLFVRYFEQVTWETKMMWSKDLMLVIHRLPCVTLTLLSYISYNFQHNFIYHVILLCVKTSSMIIPTVQFGCSVEAVETVKKGYKQIGSYDRISRVWDSLLVSWSLGVKEVIGSQTDRGNIRRDFHPARKLVRFSLL